jgi:D-alanine-D-alanine ligase
VRPRIAVIYNEPNPDLYEDIVEKKASLTILDGVKAVHQSLIELGYHVSSLALLPPLESAKEKLKTLEADLVFNLFEGFDGCPEAEASVVNYLSEMGFPFTGCSSIALSMGLDKVKTKTRLAALEIDTPRYQLLDTKTVSLFHLDYPCIVKPYAEDGSNGISEESVVHDFASLEKQVITLSKRFKKRVLVEEFIDGREFNVTVLGTKKPRTLPVSEIVYSLPPDMPRILTFSAKWDSQSIYFQHTKAVCPAEIDTELQERISRTAITAFRVLGSRGYARVDFRLNTEEKLKVIEVNPNPDISPDAGAALQAKVAGMAYSQFIEQILQLVLETK